MAKKETPVQPTASTEPIATKPANTDVASLENVEDITAATKTPVQPTASTNDAATGIAVGVATVTAISVQSNVPSNPVHPNTVRFEVKYAEDYKGEKHMPDGAIIDISKESAEQFESLGIGKLKS